MVVFADADAFVRWFAGLDGVFDLSPASVLSLSRQGAAMTAAEAERFAARPEGAAAVALRRADEAAKEVGRSVPGLDTWAPRVRGYVDDE
jgi:predicted HD phosphohydrolase